MMNNAELQGAQRAQWSSIWRARLANSSPALSPNSDPDMGIAEYVLPRAVASNITKLMDCREPVLELLRRLLSTKTPELLFLETECHFPAGAGAGSNASGCS
jgi:hypothetical protein